MLETDGEHLLHGGEFGATQCSKSHPSDIYICVQYMCVCVRGARSYASVQSTAEVFIATVRLLGGQHNMQCPGCTYLSEVLCLRWMTNMDFKERYTMFEVFSGQAEVSRVWPLGGIVYARTQGLYIEL